MDKSYEEIRKQCIKYFAKLYKDSVVFDICKVDKATRIKLQQDEVYIAETKALKASLFLNQLDILDGVLSGAYQGEKQTDQSANVLKALEMKNKLLLEDLNVNKDETNALNVTFLAMDKIDYENTPTVEINKGSNNNIELGADFSGDVAEDSFENRVKAQIKERLKELEDKKEKK